MDADAFEIEMLRPFIEFDFDRGGGPGGQNVNKVSTRAILLFDFERCDLLDFAQKAHIRARMARRLAADGRLRIVSQSERSQATNRAIAEDRLLELLKTATYVPTVRRPTRPTAGSKRRRLDAKKRRSATKRMRGGDAHGD